MSLRWYQAEAVAAVWNYLRTESGSPLVVLPTGSGKTHVIAELCRQIVEWGGRALVLAHVKELLEQSREKLARILPPESVGLYSAGLNERTTNTPVIVAGIQSVYTRAQELGEFKLIIVDEAHLIPAAAYGRYRQFLSDSKEVSPDARLVGLTATPYRMGCGWISKDRANEESDDDGAGISRQFDNTVYEVTTDKLIADGTLSCVVSKAAKRAPDFSGVHTVRGDFDESEIEKVLAGKNVLESACAEIVEQTKDRNKVLVFCNRRESARRCARLLSDYDPEHAAEIVDGETPSNERDELLKRFKGAVSSNLLGENEKPLKYVCNVGVLTTGFDAPNVDAVALLRPTKSLTLYQQIVGRGLRTAPEKRNCLVLDFGGNIDRHGPIDLPNPTSEGRERAAKPWKTCKACGAVVSIALSVCPLCGEPFEKRETDVNAGLVGSASRAAILSDQPDDDELVVEDRDVLRVEYSVHYKRDAPEKPPTLQVKYICARFRTEFEWVCPEHNAWVRKKFEKWWREKSAIEPPTTTEEACELANAGALGTPKKIQLTRKFADRFARIAWVEWDPPTVGTLGASELDEPTPYSEFSEYTIDETLPF